MTRSTINGRAVSLAFAAAFAGACASAPPIGSRPAAFPGAPPHSWATTRDQAEETVMRRVLDTAVGLRGSRYQFGGTTPQSGFDCSGFVRYVFAQYHLEIPRTAEEQYRMGHEVARAHIGAGDLVFFSTTGPGATHVGIVVDPVAQTFVHAPGTGAVVRVERFDTPYWRSRMLAARRLPVPVRPAVEARSGG
jgi:cell wall-associated NlpC family hydrolase